MYAHHVVSITRYFFCHVKKILSSTSVRKNQIGLGSIYLLIIGGQIFKMEKY